MTETNRSAGRSMIHRRRSSLTSSTLLVGAIVLAQMIVAPQGSWAAEPTAVPTMVSGSVDRLGDTGVRGDGVTVLDGFAYTASGTKILKIDVSNGVTSVLSGTDSAGCDTGAAGSSSSFHTPKVVGNDGSLIYVSDPVCDVRTVSPVNGATAYSSVVRGEQHVIVGSLGYTLNADGHVYQRNLSTGFLKILASGIPAYRTALAADSKFVWLATDHTLRRIALTTDDIADVQLPLPFALSTAMVSVGDYLYAGAWGDYLFQISKDAATTRLVAGETAHNDSVLTSINGIAADGTKIYVSDSAGVSTVSSADRTYAATARGDQVVYAAMTNAALLPAQENGLAVIGDNIYTAAGTQIVKTPMNGGLGTVLAGKANQSGCADGSIGTNTTFNTPKVIGTDGSLIYVADCEVRSVNPISGATRSIPGGVVQGIVANGRVFTLNNGTLSVRNLRTGVSNVLVNGVSPWTAMAADDDFVWLVTDRKPGSAPTNTERFLIQVAIGGVPDLATNDPIGKVSVIANNLPASAYGQMASIGDFLYVQEFPANDDAGVPQQSRLTAIRKLDGQSAAVKVKSAAGLFLSPWSGEIGGLTTNGTDLFTIDVIGSGSSVVRRLHPEADIDDLDYRNFIPEDTTLIPTNNNVGIDDVFNAGPRLIYDPVTNTCVDFCAGIYQWSQNMFEADGVGEPAWWHAFECGSPMTPAPDPHACDRLSYEKSKIKDLVASQGIFTPDGSLAADFKNELFFEYCLQNVTTPSTSCTSQQIEQSTASVQKVADIIQALQTLTYGRAGVTKRELTDDEKAVRDRLQKLAEKACKDTPDAGLTPQKWGVAVHNAFEVLVQGMGDDGVVGGKKIFGETIYLNGTVEQMIGSRRPFGSTAPDAVFGSKDSEPELMFDLKTGHKGILSNWLGKLFDNLPQGFKDAAVIKLTC